ncbi:MAG TPA: UbiA-like polyprenyltransferase [Gemmatimonadaceae bacterium]|jgi:4-hydroxybenzoate polyprenyltransferase|nr:UbiA-like polyprenyltransferase [Gemmatimonadaceae bacterium]
MTSPREGQTFSGASRWTHYINFVKLPHTVFALPFALVGATLATNVRPVTLGALGWIVLAFTAARFAAMGFNRIVDREVDAANPRTAGRELPRGALELGEAIVAVSVACALFVLAAWQLNPLCAWLAPLALGWVFFYSYTKRFTKWSHVVLGIGLGIAPVGGYLAVTGSWSDPWWLLIALAGAVMTWVGGFDILYSLQDVDFDRERGLHSIPAALGTRRAITVARVMHALTVFALVLAGIRADVGLFYGIGVAVVALLLAFEHRLVHPNDLSRLDAAFFTMNGVISITFFVFVVIDRLVHGRTLPVTL